MESVTLYCFSFIVKQLEKESFENETFLPPSLLFFRRLFASKKCRFSLEAKTGELSQ